MQSKFSEDVFYVLTFNSTSFAIQAEKIIKKDFKIAVMPTPRELSASCGLAVRFMENSLEDIKEYIQKLKIPSTLYSMTHEKVEGKRTIEKIIKI